MSDGAEGASNEERPLEPAVPEAAAEPEAESAAPEGEASEPESEPEEAAAEPGISEAASEPAASPPQPVPEPQPIARPAQPALSREMPPSEGSPGRTVFLVLLLLCFIGGQVWYLMSRASKGPTVPSHASPSASPSVVAVAPSPGASASTHPSPSTAAFAQPSPSTAASTQPSPSAAASPQPSPSTAASAHPSPVASASTPASKGPMGKLAPGVETKIVPPAGTQAIAPNVFVPEVGKTDPAGILRGFVTEASLLPHKYEAPGGKLVSVMVKNLGKQAHTIHVEGPGLSKDIKGLKPGEEKWVGPVTLKSGATYKITTDGKADAFGGEITVK